MIGSPGNCYALSDTDAARVRAIIEATQPPQDMSWRQRLRSLTRPVVELVRRDPST